MKNLFKDGSFAINSVNHSSYVDNHTVHVPNAGSVPTVTVNRSTFPGTVVSRTDNDLTYDISELTTEPFRIGNAEIVELSYDKRASILGAHVSVLTESADSALIKSWVPSGFDKVLTSGASVSAHLVDATGNRKAVTISDILAIKKLFDKNNIPAEGRYALLDYEMMAELLESLTQNQYNAFLNSANAQTGIVGELYGFRFYQRSEVLRTVAAGTSLATTNATTDGAAGLFWQRDCVARALGNTEVFESNNDPTYYGDIISCLVRAGGHYTRYDKKGVAVLAQATPSA
ncbi:MAG: hypothetical protein MJZ66_02800 [Bacteroidales bacterium]|nr:hypothetical protein [Bacteroidales bacterium]